MSSRPSYLLSLLLKTLWIYGDELLPLGLFGTTSGMNKHPKDVCGRFFSLFYGINTPVGAISGSA
jgi:hypothetical protein